MTLNELTLRSAIADDAQGVGAVLAGLAHAGLRDKPCDPDFALAHYIAHSARIRCTIALIPSGKVVGFQSLKRAWAQNPYDTPEGWGIIGTHIAPEAARQGIGRRLFAETLAAARGAGLPAIEAFIGADNAPAVAYYAALGFRTWRTLDGVDAKLFEIGGAGVPAA